MKKIVMAIALAFTLAACGDNVKKVDASSASKYTESVQAISKELSPEKQVQFAQALAKISATAFAEANSDQTKAFDIIKGKINGKSADDVIAAAK